MKKIDIPEWAKKCQIPNTTIKPNGKGFGLYSCTSVYSDGKSRSIQTYLGKISKDKGFIPKKENSPLMTGALPQEYGLSFVTMVNLHNLQESLYNGGDGAHRGILLRLAVVQFVFRNYKPFYIKASSVSRGKEKEMLERALTVNPDRINRLEMKIRDFYCLRIPDDTEREEYLETLKMITIPADMPKPSRPIFPEVIVSASRDHKIRLYKGEHLK